MTPPTAAMLALRTGLRLDGLPSVQRLLGLPWLLSALHPVGLPPATMRADAAELLSLLCGIAADDALVAQLSGG